MKKGIKLSAATVLALSAITPVAAYAAEPETTAKDGYYINNAFISAADFAKKTKKAKAAFIKENITAKIFIVLKGKVYDLTDEKIQNAKANEVESLGKEYAVFKSETGIELTENGVKPVPTGLKVESVSAITNKGFTVKFASTADLSELTDTNVILTPEDGSNAVTGAVTYDNTAKTASVSATLIAGKTYTISGWDGVTVGSNKVVVPAADQLVVASVNSVTKTTVTVVLNNEAKEVPAASFFTVSDNTVTKVAQGVNAKTFILTLETSLDGKKGSITVNGQSKDYDFATVVEKAKTETVTFVNYRSFDVTFSTIVDHATAIDPANYYFEIVDGNAGAKLGEAQQPTLGNTNSLAGLVSGVDLDALVAIDSYKALYDEYLAKVGKVDITATNSEKAAAKNYAFFKNVISAKDVNGKTVVTITLPENARFGTSKDDLHAIVIDRYNGDSAIKTLYKDVTINVAVRNVKDAQGKRTIDTAVFPMTISDNKAPTVDKVISKKLTATDKFEDVVTLAPNGTKTINVERADLTSTLNIGFDEPVLVAKGASAAADTVKLYVNGQEIEGPLYNEIIKFATDNYSYEAGKRATLDLGKALETALSLSDGKFEDTTDASATTKLKNQVFNIKVIGITDIAGNIQTPSTTEFNVKVVDPNKFVDTQVEPEVLGVKQIEDNILRVQWNRADATGEFTLTSPEGKEEVTGWTTLSKKDADGKYYSYFVFEATDGAYVPAVEEDLGGEGEEDDIHAAPAKLGYNDQTFLDRKYTITKVGAFKTTPDASKEITEFKAGKDAEGAIKLYKDTSAPVFKTLELASDYKTSHELVLKVNDTVNGYTEDLVSPVIALKADGTVADGRKAEADELQDLIVSYVGEDGAKRSKTITSATADGTGELEFADNTLKIDLSGVTELLDKDGNLVAGATYSVTLPAKYFADLGTDVSELAKKSVGGSLSDRIIASAATAVDGSVTSYTTAAAFDGYQALYVDGDRTAKVGFLTLGYNGTVAVPLKDETGSTPSDAVPQTSKGLIRAIKEGENWIIEVQYKGGIDIKTLRNPDNYILNGEPLSAYGVKSSDIEYRVDGSDVNTAEKFAVFTVPANSVSATGPVSFVVQNVANEFGGKMTPVVTTLNLEDNTAPKVINASTNGSKTIVLTYDEPLTFKVAGEEVGTDNWKATAPGKNYVVKAGDKTISVESVVIRNAFISKFGTVVELHLSDDIPTTGSVTVETVKDQNNDILVTDAAKNPINLGNVTVR